MNVPIATLTLQAAPARPGGFDPMFLMMMVSLFLIFYLLVFRPQQKRQREQEDMLKSIAKGDRVVTTGGVHGKVVGTTDDVLTLEIDEVKGVRVKIDRRGVERRIERSAEGKKEGSKE